MERFNLKEHWQDFINGRIVVNCKTENLSNEFLKYCEYKELKGILPSVWNYFKENTCYRICYTNKSIYLASLDFYKKEIYPILSFEGFDSESVYENEIFNLENYWEDFINSDIVVNCKTEELASEFLGYCQNEKGLLWWGKDQPMKETYWADYNEKTCYRFVNDRIRYDNINYYKKNGFKITSFEGFNKSIIENNDTQTKPPIGVIPKDKYDILRIQELTRALYEYSKYFNSENKLEYELMIEWTDELFGLLQNKI